MGPSLLTSWTFDPGLIALAAAAFLYARRARTLAHRGMPVPAWQQWSFGIGVALVSLSLASPIDAFAEEQFLSAHMIQHVLLGDLGPLAMVGGLTGSLLRPLLALSLVERLRVFAHPLVALPLWAVNMLAWHVPFAYQGALHHDAVHALEHVCFFTFGALMWAPVIEVLPAPEWFGTGIKLGYIVVVRLVETVLGNVFVWSGTVFYPFYEHVVDRWGISADADQGIAGAIMMLEGSLVTLAALAWLFLRLGRESELRQRLLEEGVDARVAARAVRYGRGEALGAGRTSRELSGSS